MFILLITLPNLFIPDIALSSTMVYTHQETVSGQACSPPDPHWYFLLPLVEEFYSTRYQSGSVSSISVESETHCLRTFFFLFL
jgi:hypothetical protein